MCIRSESILIKINRRIVNAQREDPPYEKNGRGIPITGASPMVMPMLMAK